MIDSRNVSKCINHSRCGSVRLKLIICRQKCYSPQHKRQDDTQKRKQEHLHAADEVFSDTFWNGYRKSSLFPLLPELTSITLMGLVFSPFGSRLDSDCFHISFASELKSGDHCLYILTRILKYI